MTRRGTIEIRKRGSTGDTRQVAFVLAISTHERAKAAADNAGVSLSLWMEQAIEEKLARKTK
jgi:predicted HicB family RNase H-like nuclease